MHPRIQEVLDHLDRHHADLAAAIAQVLPERHARRPAADRWSATEIVEHLGIVEARISSMLSDQLNKARASGLGPERDHGPVLPTVDVAALLDRSVQRVASEATLPRGSMNMSDAWSRLEQLRGALRETVRTADGLALGQITSPHARLGPLNMY